MEDYELREKLEEKLAASAGVCRSLLEAYARSKGAASEATALHEYESHRRDHERVNEVYQRVSAVIERAEWQARAAEEKLSFGLDRLAAVRAAPEDEPPHTLGSAQ